MDSRTYLGDLSKKCIQHPPMRLKTWDREKLIRLFKELEFTKGAEIGVEKGKFSEYMLKTIPNLDLLCVDSWTPGEDRMSQAVGLRFAAEREAEARARLANYPRAKIVKGFSMDIVRDIPYESLDFVYIDACHDFDFVVQDIVEWAKRVKKGGIVAGHDYYKFRSAGVIEAVDAYIKCHQIRLAFLTKELTPSWFFLR